MAVSSVRRGEGETVLIEDGVVVEAIANNSVNNCSSVVRKVARGRTDHHQCEMGTLLGNDFVPLYATASRLSACGSKIYLSDRDTTDLVGQAARPRNDNK